MEPLVDFTPVADSKPNLHIGTIPGIEADELIGCGSSSKVYRARQLSFERTIALKVLDQSTPCDHQRFEREARILSALHHPNIARIWQYGLDTCGNPYFAMEYIEGQSLADFLHSCAPLNKEQILQIFLPLCDALEAVHRAGVIHRDIKPANIMLSQTVDAMICPKLVDFGIAKSRMRPGEATLTGTNCILGTPAYMSPEQCRAEEARPPSDIYALGCVLFECLTGKPPFQGDGSVEIMLQHMYQDLPSPDRLIASLNLPPALCHCLLKALNKDAEARFQSAQEFASALAGALDENLPRIAKSSDRNRRSAAIAITVMLLLTVALTTLYREVRQSKAAVANTSPDSTRSLNSTRPLGFEAQAAKAKELFQQKQYEDSMKLAIAALEQDYRPAKPEPVYEAYSTIFESLSHLGGYASAPRMRLTYAQRYIQEFKTPEQRGSDYFGNALVHYALTVDKCKVIARRKGTGCDLLLDCVEKYRQEAGTLRQVKSALVTYHMEQPAPDYKAAYSLLKDIIARDRQLLPSESLGIRWLVGDLCSLYDLKCRLKHSDTQEVIAELETLLQHENLKPADRGGSLANLTKILLVHKEYALCDRLIKQGLNLPFSERALEPHLLRVRLGRAYAGTGRLDEARRILEQSKQNRGGILLETDRATVSNEKQKLEAELAKLEALQSSRESL